MAEPRVAVVTGGSRGIGAEITRQLAGRGLRVACTYRSGKDEANALAAELATDVLTVHFELGDAESAESLVATVLERFGRLDTLVLNAGVWHGGRLEDLDPSLWWRVLESNVGGAAQVARAALPALRRGSAPSVTLVSSAVGIIGFPGDTAYGSAKAAMTGFARSLAKEVGRDGIRVNVLAPGFVETDMTAAIPERSRERIIADMVLRRLGTAAEVARAAVFLAEDATYCTGTILTVDGGWSL
ncbi:SDR family NAD(P)-dependent oxidoreductase [Actinophytocola sp.]|jgi:3-oxoacyl-[acyl-carrier protein] reductase|uniref:SDR family NAD(P)-dependent oxidoreductase n=1 Tax=Actinophytocola sp. TaxID=1872138 RepID=UPI002ED877D1